MKFYPSDWRADPALRVCSLAARGLWVEMLCIMHEATPRGYLTIKGRDVTEAQLATLSGTPLEEITNLIGELETMGVFSRDGKGCIYSRRILRDEKKSKTAQKNGKNGGNPKLSSNGKQKKTPSSDNLQDNTTFKGQDKTQKPEARSQKPEERDNSKLSSLSDAQARDEDFIWIREDGFRWFLSRGLTETQAEGHVSDWLKEYPAKQVRDAIATASVSAPGNPVRYVAGILRNGPRSNLQTFPNDRAREKADEEQRRREAYQAELDALREPDPEEKTNAG
jgi:hypothetical protein